MLGGRCQVGHSRPAGRWQGKGRPTKPEACYHGNYDIPKETPHI